MSMCLRGEKVVGVWTAGAGVCPSEDTDEGMNENSLEWMWLQEIKKSKQKPRRTPASYI